MTTRDQTFDRLLTTIEQRERSTRRAAVLWTIVPALLAVAFLGYSVWRLETASRQVAELEDQAETARQELEASTRQLGEIGEQAKALTAALEERTAQNEAMRKETEALTRELEEQAARNAEIRREADQLRRELDETQALLARTLELSQYRFDVTPVTVKMISSRHPREAEILRFIIELREQGVGWHLGGQAPEDGFDSPSFAEFVLRQFRLAPGGATAGLTLLEASRRLYDTLPRARSPQVGDLVFYPSGYVMFYFVDRQDRPFVIGMTPFGIVALKWDFARIDGYRRPAAR